MTLRSYFIHGLLLSIICIAGETRAATLVNESPTVLGGAVAGTWSNTSTGQNFLVQFTLGATTALNEMDIYTGLITNFVGNQN
jgi:hypothetical protein